jgi:hypothetical protein
VKRNCTLVIARKRLVQKTASPVGVMCITKPAKLYCGTKKKGYGTRKRRYKYSRYIL